MSSLKEIAKIVGVSPSTVSRVLNHSNRSCASKEVSEHIFRVANELNYVPNTYARRLQNGGSEKPVQAPKRIAIIMMRIASLEADPFFTELFHMLERELYQRNCILEQLLFGEEAVPSNLTACDGLILLGRCSEKQLQKFKKISPNIVGIWRNPMDFEVDEVICDGKKAAELAVSHLIGLGHRQIAYIGDCSFETRYVGYCDMLIRHQLPINYRLILPIDSSLENGYQAMRQLMDRGEDFSAVFCANDITALGVLQALNEAPPETAAGISIISIDNIETLQQYKPLLTTVNIPRAEMAHMAVALLLDRISHRHNEYMRLELPCRIIKRESTHPYPAPA